MNDPLKQMADEFTKRFGSGGDVFAVRAPGRVNLIGEHTDYNDGYVLPIGMSQAVMILGRAAQSRESRYYSMNFNEEFTCNPESTAHGAHTGWGAYIQGTALALERRLGASLRGVDAVVWGDVPLGSGLSSSAALEVASGFFMLQANDIELPLPELARACQEAENTYVGVHCGIMDQFASCLAESDQAIFLDCRSLDYTYVPLNLDEHLFLILNTRVPRTLAGSAYNDRRSACEQGVAALRKRLPHIKALRDVAEEEFQDLEHILDPDIAAKCRHIITENARVLQSVACLRGGDLQGFGRLMNASHASLRDDYSVTCRELDVLHDAARDMDGVLGERMTGAGFGGCAVALVRAGTADHAQRQLAEIYLEKTGIALEVYRTAAMQGVRRIDP